MPAIILGNNAVNFALPNDETGLNVETIRTKYNNPRAELQGRQGNTVAVAVNFDPSIEITITGEIAGATGHAAANFVGATTIATTYAGHGIPAGGAYLIDCEEERSRTGYAKLTSTYKVIPGIS